jgi:hypothetical protein
MLAAAVAGGQVTWQLHSSACSVSQGYSMPVTLQGLDPQQQQHQQQPQGEPARQMPASVLAAASAGHSSMTLAVTAATGAPMCVSSSSSSLRQTAAVHIQQQQQQSGASSKSAAAVPDCTAAAAGSSAAAAGGFNVDGSTAVTLLTLECDHAHLVTQDPALTAAAVGRAAAAITQHPRTINSASRAVAAAGGVEPPPVVVSEIEAALRTAAAQSVKQLQPGGSHYWRGKNAWRLQHQGMTQGQHSGSHSSAATAAAEAKAGTPDAAVAAAIAAADAAGRHCSAADLHAAWLMQRLDAGQLDVTVASPLVDMSALEQALANHGADLIPGNCCSFFNEPLYHSRLA